jgi:hypothetical protein
VSPSGLSLRMVRSRSDFDRLLGILEPLEPRATLLAALLLSGPGSGRRVYVVERDGDVLAVAGLGRRCLDRWGAFCVTLDDAAAPIVARRIDRSPAREVIGFEQDLVPLVPHLGRAREVWGAPVVRSDWPYPDVHLGPPVDPRVRIAAADDIGALTELYAGYELDDIPTRFQLRRSLRRSLAASLPTVVLEVDGRLVGGVRMLCETRRYSYWGDQTVLPEYRGRGLSYAFAGLVSRTMIERERGYLSQIAPSNPSDRRAFVVEHFRGSVDPNAATTLTVRLRTPVRFRGQGRFRHLAARLGGSRPRRVATQYRDPRR